MTTNKYWDDEWAYSEIFIPEMIERICAEYDWGDPVVEIADRDADVYHNTDLILYLKRWPKLRFDIAARVRRPKFIIYPNDITVRNILALNGVLYKDNEGRILGETEYQKLRRGNGDIECYCIAAEDEKHLARFCLGSLDALRKLIEKEAEIYHEWRKYTTPIGDEGMVYATWKPSRQRPAGNTGCGFLCYQKSEIPGFVIADYQIERVTA